MNIKTLPHDLFAFLSRAYTRSKTRVIIAGVLVLALIGFGIYAVVPKGAAPATENETEATRSVTLKSVAALSTNAEDVAIVGTINSKSEATVHTESTGQVTGVYRQLGDKVAAGAVIAEMENASQRAAVQQAQGGVQAAQANLAKVKAGARAEQIAILQSATVSAHTSAVNALLSAYAALDDAVHHTADLMFSNPDTYSPTVNLTVTDSQLTVDLKDSRIALTSVMARQAARSNTLVHTDTSVSLKQEIAATELEVRTARIFFDDLIEALGKTVVTDSVSATDIAAFKASASAARGSLTASLSALATVDNALTSADQNLALGTKGGTAEDIAAAEASVMQAQGGLAAARASLEKTIVRAPISGTINQISLTRGNFEAAGTPVVTIANNGSLEAVAYVTEQDALRIAAGDKVTIGSEGTGTVTRIASALDPVTKKIEVRIALAGLKDLTNGQSVIIHFGGKTPRATDIKEIIIPIAAIKIEVDATSVFFVDESNTLVAHPIVLGTLLGDRVIVLEGLKASDTIVTDARGLKNGMKVSVQ